MRFSKNCLLIGCAQRGAALVELAISILLMILIMGGCWMLLTGEDARHTVLSSVYAGLNRPQNQVFQTDVSGVLKQHDATSVAGMISDIRSEVADRFRDSSPLSAWLSVLSCDFQLNYITLASGVAQKPVVSVPGAPGSGATQEQQIAHTAAINEANAYLTKLENKPIQPANSKAQFFSEYHFPTDPPATMPSADEFYFDNFAFFTWGCVVQRDLFLMDIDTTYSGVFVPNRML